LAAACAAPTEEARPDAPSPTPAPERHEGTASLEGNVDGAEVRLASAIAIPGVLSTRAPDKRGFRIVLSTEPGVCASQASVMRPGMRALTLDVESRDIAEARTYVVPEPFSGERGVHARFELLEPECRAKALVATAGTLTIDENDGVNVRGSFDFFMGHDHVVGRFDAALCETPPSGTVDLDRRCEP
jgi:hypothetical protein